MRGGLQKFVADFSQPASVEGFGFRSFCIYKLGHMNPMNHIPAETRNLAVIEHHKRRELKISLGRVTA